MRLDHHRRRLFLFLQRGVYSASFDGSWLCKGLPSGFGLLVDLLVVSLLRIHDLVEASFLEDGLVILLGAGESVVPFGRQETAPAESSLVVGAFSVDDAVLGLEERVGLESALLVGHLLLINHLALGTFQLLSELCFSLVFSAHLSRVGRVVSVEVCVELGLVGGLTKFVGLVVTHLIL